MSKQRQIRCFDYVNRGYAQVRDALQADTLGALSRATKTAAARAEAVAVQLHVHVAGMDVGKEVDLSIGKISEAAAGPGRSTPVTRLPLEWKARESANLFPLMHAELSVYPLTATETQLDLSGHYDPPLGLFGGAVDAVVGHRIAEATIHRFMSDVAEYLRRTLS
ncbi:MAG TPA: hypothetical protein VL241_03655 [Gemmatimonadales bacterium]|nr:hypothetical protein [Gemmatimonadales bacterium]